MKILLIGSGGREHALAWQLSQSRLCDRLFIAPGNPGTAECGTNIALDIMDCAAILDFAEKEKIEFVVIGPEAPLTIGLSDELEKQGIRVFGPSQAAARLEGSKGFTKNLCREYNIPTAAYEIFTDADRARAYIRQQGAPIVVKADGLAAGKGVVVAQSIEEAEEAVQALFSGSLGTAGHQVIIEECLEGEEVSFFVLCDGMNALAFGSAQDHKRAFDKDQGPNTGGMGAYSPASIVTPELEKQILRDIINPTLKGMNDRGTPFKGVLFAGLMLTDEGPKLIEYNVRFGDPECQVLMRRLASDLGQVLWSAANGQLDDIDLKFDNICALVVIMAAKGYPATYETGSFLKGIEKSEDIPNVKVFHSGTALNKNGQLVASGGRVLSVTATGQNVTEAQKRVYEAVNAIDWPEGFFRKDIGWREISRKKD